MLGTKFSYSLWAVIVLFVKSSIAADSCFTPKSELGECILLTDCPAILNILHQRPISVEDANYLKRAGCGFEGLQSKVCCPQQVQEVTTSTTARPTGSTKTEQNDLLPSIRECGVSNGNRIIGGSIADIDEYPWMVLIEYRTRTGTGFYCGGVLINDRYVLTAAHCVNGKDLPTTWKLISVRLGEFNTSSEVDCVRPNTRLEVCAPMPQDIPVEQQIPHEQYDPQSLDQYHDIALLRLSRSVQYNGFISPVCLPTSEVHLRSSFQDQSLDVAGWGKTENASASDVKLKLRVEVRSNDVCGSIYSAARIKLGEGQMCAGGKRGQDSCRGDSGGPLMGGLVNGADVNTYVLGVVSFGPTPCGMEGWPGVYTRVNKYVPWIKSHLRP